MDISVKNAIAISFAAGVVAGCSLTLLLLTLYKIIRLPQQQQQRQRQQRPEEERRGLDALDISPPLESSTALLAEDGPPHFSTFFRPSDDYLPMGVRIYENIQEKEDHYETIPAAHYETIPAAEQDHYETIAEAEEDHYETIAEAEEDHCKTIAEAEEDHCKTIAEAEEDHFENIPLAVTRPIPPPPPPPPPFPALPQNNQM